jgi:hypothetical protein
VRTVRNTKIRWHDRWVPYPFENGVGHLTKAAIVDCVAGYIEAYAARRSGAPCPANFGDWIQWRMGSRLRAPLHGPVQREDLEVRPAHDGERLGRRPRARSADRGHRQVGRRPRHRGLHPPVGVLVPQARRLRSDGARHRRRRRVHSALRRRRAARGTRGGGFRVDGEAFDLVVNTVPLPQIEPAIADLPEAIRADIRQLRPISLVNLMIGVALDEPLPPLSWIYLPFAEQGPTNRVTYFSNYSPHNAPAGHGSFLAEVTHRGDTAPGCGLAARRRPRPRQRRHPASRTVVLLERATTSTPTSTRT